MSIAKNKRKKIIIPGLFINALKYILDNEISFKNIQIKLALRKAVYRVYIRLIRIRQSSIMIIKG